MNNPGQILVFDRALVRQRREKAVENFVAHSVLFDEVAAQLIERLKDVKPKFASILDLSPYPTVLADHLREKDVFTVSASLDNQASLVADEEFLPFAANSFDLVVSNLALHWVNDLPGALVQIRNALRSGGMFLAALLGGGTLHELRSCLLEAELSVTGGVSPRLSPTIELKTASGLMQRAGFDLPVADQENFTLTYTDAFALMRDLRGMGEANAHLQRLRQPTRRSVFAEAARLYQSRFADAEGRIPATFEVIFLHGWKANP